MSWASVQPWNKGKWYSGVPLVRRRHTILNSNKMLAKRYQKDCKCPDLLFVTEDPILLNWKKNQKYKKRSLFK